MSQDRKWIKAEASAGGGGCLEFADNLEEGMVLMRDSKLGDQSPILLFRPSEITAFLDGREKGEFVRKLELLT